MSRGRRVRLFFALLLALPWRSESLSLRPLPPMPLLPARSTLRMSARLGSQIFGASLCKWSLLGSQPDRSFLSAWMGALLRSITCQSLPSLCRGYRDRYKRLSSEGRLIYGVQPLQGEAS